MLIAKFYGELLRSTQLEIGGLVRLELALLTEAKYFCRMANFAKTMFFTYI